MRFNCEGTAEKLDAEWWGIKTKTAGVREYCNALIEHIASLSSAYEDDLFYGMPDEWRKWKRETFDNSIVDSLDGFCVDEEDTFTINYGVASPMFKRLLVTLNAEDVRLVKHIAKLKDLSHRIKRISDTILDEILVKQSSAIIEEGATE
jgi:hypothetical protein